MTKYRLIHSLAQFQVYATHPEYRIVEDYRAGDATASDFDDIVGWFDDIASALSALRGYRTDIYRRGDTVCVDEYGIEAVTIDEDGEESEWEYIEASALPEAVRGEWHYRFSDGQYRQVDEDDI